ncbi:MAG: replicative DNA helicase, partial [Firmicutes bacterium]|nr:replicative DNA helicase [Bacillota bacterium]
VSEELKKRRTLEMAGGRAYVAELSGEVPSTANAIEYAQIVAEKAILRRLIRTSGDIMDSAFAEQKPTEDILNHAEQAVFEISQGRTKSGYVALSDVLKENLVMLDELSRNKDGLTGLSTGFRDLDKMTAGLQKGNLIILAARPAMGKTSFALSLAHNAATKKNAKILFVSLEMAETELGSKLLSIESKVDLGKLKVGNVNEDDWKKLYVAVDRLANAGIYIDTTPGADIAGIRSRARRLKADKEKGLDLLVVDYLQLMSIDSRSNSLREDVTQLSRQFKQLARELEIPIILLSQLSRKPEERSDHRPMLSDLRESGSIEQDADVVLFLYRDEVYDQNTPEPGIAEVIIAKQRSGPTGTVKVAWLANQTRFADAARENTPKPL